MNTSIVLAQIFGTIFLVLGLSMFLNKRWTSLVVERITEDEAILWIAGLITITMGSSIIVLNNIWTSGLPLLVTILGWLTLIKGAFILIFPKSTFSYYKKMNKGNIFVWGGLIVFVLGLILIIR